MPTQSSTNLQNYEPALKAGFQLPNAVVPGISTTWGSQTIVISKASGFAGTTAVPLTPTGGAPVAATIKFVQIIPTNTTSAVWEISSATNTKAFVVSTPTGSTASAQLVVGATSILNVGIAAAEVINLTSVTAGGSAIVVIGIETAN